jgi:peptidyl-prolyl cis-trans isomerase SurA
MRRIFLIPVLFIPGIFALQQEVKAQTLFTYGSKSATSKSFIRAFNKNPGEGDRKKAMEEYLPLYINYVLKVQDAYDKRYDTLPTQQQELMNYKIQLAEGFIAEKSGAEALVDEAIGRMQEEVLLGHIYIGYNNGDSAAANKRAQEAIAQLKAGKQWSEVALQYSTDEAVKSHKGIIGWIGPFVIPYTYETIVYGLPKGGYSKALPASEGVHIFSKRDTRPGAGTVQVAQILIADMAGLTAEDRNQRARLADSLYDALQKGSSFQNLVAEFSEDRSTKYQGGELQPFGTGSYDPIFEAKAFALKTAGEYTKPFVTAYGWHILKLIAKTPPPAKTDEEARSLLRQKVASDGRLEKSREAYIKSKMPAMKFKAGTVTPAQLQAFTDSVLNNSEKRPAGLSAKTVLFSLGKTAYTLDDWTAFVRVQTMSGSMAAGEKIGGRYEEFVMGKASEYLPEHLDEIEPDFAFQFREFKDANLLFEAMERNVWNKAMEDTAGLRKYYDGRKDNYRWEENVLAILVTGNDSMLVMNARTRLAGNAGEWRRLNEEFEGRVYADSSRYELSAFAWARGSNIVPGTCTTPERSDMDNSYSFACIIEKGKAGEIRSFEEARGFVASDYQQVLEAEWIAALKKKYPVKVNDAEWKKLLAGL